MEHTFSFFPFGALFCFTLFCFVAVRIFAIRYRYGDNKQMDRLKDLVINGELTETEYQRLKNLLTK
ncbi:SHOCT domain-containing protein [Cytobacillus praedii]|uniref:SHOCT domain-containing protein n=1 Tax=Cytobacillus praedii TaxID=1742358 RepID=UPI003F811AF2